MRAVHVYLDKGVLLQLGNGLGADPKHALEEVENTQ